MVRKQPTISIHKNASPVVAGRVELSSLDASVQARLGLPLQEVAVPVQARNTDLVRLPKNIEQDFERSFL